jgi:uncharacterized protein YecT (DUF1311 family)
MEYKNIKCLFAIAISLMHTTLSAQSGQKEKDCWDTAMTQMDLTACAGQSASQADAKLNQVYNAILKEYKADTAFVNNLKESERIWGQLRNAEMKVKYPDREVGWYGSAQPMCYYLYLAKLTDERTKYLQQWLDGIKEGDICIGSVKLKQ